MKIEIFARRGLFGRRWYFRIVAANGEPLAQSEGYHNKSDVAGATISLRGKLGDASIVWLG